MSLTSLDSKLNKLAKSLDGELIKEDSKGMLLPNGYEERIIRWHNNGLNYLIQICPEIKNDNIRKWLLWACCYYDTDKARYWKKITVLNCRKQNKIFSDFDGGIERALNFLNHLTKDDLEKAVDFNR